MPQQADKQAHTLIKGFRDSAPYINAHRGKTFVLMLGGEAVAHPNFTHLIHDIALLNSLGVRLVLACGARPQIDALLETAGTTSAFHAGLRITDEATLAVVKQATGVIRANVEAALSTGVVNSPMHGANIRVVSGNYVIAKPIGVRDGVDFHHTGEVRKIDVHAMRQALDHDAIVLLTCLGYSPTGEAFNLSVEDVATQAAIGLGADKLILLSAQSGVLDTKDNLLRQLDADACKQLLGHKKTAPAQKALLQACLTAINENIPRAHVISHAQDGALLTELFTRDGAGTLITASDYETVRAATIDDVGGVLELIRPLEEEGVLVRRSRELLENEISYFTVIERDGMIIACVALYPYAASNMGEIACVATHADYRGKQRASALLEHAEKQARKQKLKKVFVLTTRTAHWFVEKGFKEASLNLLPDEKQALYNYQRNSKIFIKSI